MIRATAPLALTLLATLAVAGPVAHEYRLDDGAGNFLIGPSQFDANMTWLNTFQAEPGFERITRVRVAFGGIEDNNGVAGSDLVTVAVLEDPNNDADPTDAVLLATGTGRWVDAGLNAFVEFDLDEPVTVTGIFFVAVMMDVRERANPARMDPQGEGAGSLSWMFFNPAPNLDDLGSSPYVLRMSDSPFQGAWMIRAEGVAPCAADLNQDGTLDLFDLLAFLDAYDAGDALADFAPPYGTVDLFDLLGFVQAFSAGCP